MINGVNCRLNVKGVAFILRHGECKLLLVDREFANPAAAALERLGHRLTVIDINDHLAPIEPAIGETDYERLIASEGQLIAL